MIVMQGHDRNGWDTAVCETMNDIKDFLNHPHHGTVWAYVDGDPKQAYVVPSGLGVRVAEDPEDMMFL